MRSAPPSQIRSDINVTPLVDVCLVLLIIFMVVTPILTSGPPVELPRANKPEKRPQTPNQLPIYLLFDDPPQILFGASLRRVDPAEFGSIMREVKERSPDQRIVLRADRRLTYGSVKAALQAMRQAGFQNVDLVAEKVTPE